jgi:hypothetical protein
MQPSETDLSLQFHHIEKFEVSIDAREVKDIRRIKENELAALRTSWGLGGGVLRARRGIKNDSSDIIELSKGFQPIAIVSISKKRKLCLSLSIDGQFTVFTIHRYPRTTI